MPVYKSTTQYTAQVPMTVTKAADTLAAICHRNDTRQVVGERVPGIANRPGYHIPIDYDAMGYIIGPELAESFYKTMAKPAYAEYFNKINERLVSVGITLAHSSEYWYLHKLPKFEPNFERLHVYTYRDLVEQAPAGYTA